MTFELKDECATSLYAINYKISVAHHWNSIVLVYNLIVKLEQAPE